jgi:hypothetical protein
MEKKLILGLIEEVTIIGKKDELVVARIDTGATSSSIDISLAGKLELGPVIQSKLVKSASGVKKRPVVKGKVKINGLTIEEEFNLADRSHMTYNVLIGQNILKKGNFLIDPNK